MCYQVRFITRSVKCMVTMRWVMAWLGNEFGCSMEDERTCTMRREVGVHLWWMMIWCVRSKKECVTTDVSQFLICPCTFLRFQRLYSTILSVVIWVIGKCFFFTITLFRTLLLRLKTSSPHLSGNKWTTPPYSPDLAARDYHLFLHLKKFLDGKQFDDDDDLKDAVQKWLTSQAAAFYEEGIPKLVLCYNKCLNNGSEYVEK